MRVSVDIRRRFLLTISVGVFAMTTAAQSVKDADAAAFASIAEQEVSQLHAGITLAEWMATRGKAEHWQSKNAEIVPGATHLECLSLVKTQPLPSGRKMTLAVYFFPPPARSPAILPASSGAKLIDSCTLGRIRVEGATPTPEIGHLLEQSVQQKFNGRFGEGLGSRNSALWRHDIEIVSNYEPKTGLADNAPFQLLQGPVVSVDAQLPIVERLRLELANRDFEYRPIEKAQFHRAIRMVGAGAVAVARMEKLYDQVFPEGAFGRRGELSGSTNWRDSLLPVLRGWLDALKAAPAAQRAAGLLAADLLIEAAEDAGSVPGRPQKPDQGSELQKLGALFKFNGVANEYYYARNWEKQARELDPEGAAGQMAVVAFLARGSCDAGQEFFRQVIRDGEELLAKRLDAQTAAQMHFMVGDAYSDIVAIAGGETGPNGEYDPARYRGEADADRSQAFRQYHAGLVLDNTSQAAKHAWSQAWRLAAGLLPNPRYLCFGD